MNNKARSQTLPIMAKRPSVPFRTFSLNLEGSRASAWIPIARGGFSDVFKVSSPDYGEVAVKRLRFNETEQDALEAMVAKEAQVLTMIKHPHILPFLGISYLDGAICIVSPWAGNGPLSSYLARKPEADRLGLLAQIASALAYLHTNVGDIIIHGDLHVDNVLISHLETALLSDFGLSRIVPEGNSSSLYRGDSANCSIGRVVYEAPELHDGEPRSWATDVFAFGMLIFHAYAGKQPFVKATNYLAAVVALYKGERPERAEILRRDFTDELWDLVCQCWGHRPRQRPRMPMVFRRMQALLDQRDQRSMPTEPSTPLFYTSTSPTIFPLSTNASGLFAAATLQIVQSGVNRGCVVPAVVISDSSLQLPTAGRRGICEYRLYIRNKLSLRGLGKDLLRWLVDVFPFEKPILRSSVALPTNVTERRHGLPVHGRIRSIILVVLVARTLTSEVYLSSEGTDTPVGQDFTQYLRFSQPSRYIENSEAERFSIERYSAKVWPARTANLLPNLSCITTTSLENLIKYLVHVSRRSHCKILAIVNPVPSQCL